MGLPAEDGRRTVPLPDFVIEALAEHLAGFPAELDELVFRNERGGPLLRANFRQRVWLPALSARVWWSGRSFMRFLLIWRVPMSSLQDCFVRWSPPRTAEHPL